MGSSTDPTGEPRRAVLAGVGLVMVGMLGGCDSTACTTVGASSQLSVALPDQDWRVVEFCAADSCVAEQALSIPDSPPTYEFKLTVAPPFGVTLTLEGVVEATRYSPNGKNCEPHVAMRF